MSKARVLSKVVSIELTLNAREAALIMALIGPTTGQLGYEIYQELSRLAEEGAFEAPPMALFDDGINGVDTDEVPQQ